VVFSEFPKARVEILAVNIGSFKLRPIWCLGEDRLPAEVPLLGSVLLEERLNLGADEDEKTGR
jgi:hypothetical protein